MPEKECNKCRTCFNKSIQLQSLSMVFADEPKEQMTYGDMLKEVTNINVMEDESSEMPQYICYDCLCKLKSSHSFIKQAQDSNEKFISLLNNRDELCIDIQPCLGIKMECSDEPFCNYETSGSEHNLDLKREIIDENPLGESMCNYKTLPEECSKKNFHDGDTFDSDSSRKGTYSESESENPSPKEKINQDISNCNDAHPKKRAKRARKRKNTSLQESSDISDADIAVPCLQCNKIFNNSKELKCHLRNAHLSEEQKCSCPQCGAKFTRPYNMYYHMRTQHGPESVKGLIPERKRTYQCDKCPRKYSQQKNLNFHIKAKHSAGESQTSETTQEDTYKKPKKVSEARHLCFICGSSFVNKTELTIHTRRHTKEMPFKCDLCNRAYPRASELKSHYRIHTGEKPYKCSICEKSFRVSAKLSSHMRSHTDERPFKCKQCERSFKYSKDLNIHTRIHTGEKPYSCNVCGNTFTQSNSLKAHCKKLGHIESST